MVVWMVLMAGHHFFSQYDTCTQLRHGIALLNTIQSEGPSCMSSLIKKQWLFKMTCWEHYIQ